MVAAENDALPNGKVGGIGDVIRDVPPVLAQQGVHVDVIVPGYRYQSTINNAELTLSLNVPFKGEIERVELYRLNAEGKDNVTQWALEHDVFALGGTGKIYCDDGANRPFASDATKFALFSASVCELLNNQWLNKIQVIHLHDWHSAFIAILRRYEQRYEALQSMRCVYTIHNLALQGIRPFSGDESSLASWFPNMMFDPQLIGDPRYHDCVNPTRAGINLSDAVHVVSPTYATEIVKPSLPSHGFIGGEGLEQDLVKAEQEQRLFGILNGCDYEQAETKKLSSTALLNYSKTQVEGWVAKSKSVLSVHFLAISRINQWLVEKKSSPLITSIGRLTDQKMAILLLNHNSHTVLEELLIDLNNNKGRMIILGSGDPVIEQQLTTIMSRHSNFIFLNGYSDALSQHLYQCGDLFLMPSSFEPCGISQMLSMRAGQACLVHKIGGLNDTVEHLTTGYTFSGDSPKEIVTQLLSAFTQCLNLFNNDQSTWKKIAKNAKEQRFYWQDSIKKYISELYQH